MCQILCLSIRDSKTDKTGSLPSRNVWVSQEQIHNLVIKYNLAGTEIEMIRYGNGCLGGWIGDGLWKRLPRSHG